MKSVPNLSLKQIYPTPCADINLNTCHDPDCGNFGVMADFLLVRSMGPNARARLAASTSNSAKIGLGKYKLNAKGKKHRRISTVFEYQNDPHKWVDRKKIECQFTRTNGPCGTAFELLSDTHVMDEAARLRSANGAFAGPKCRACGRDYLDAPDEFLLDGAEVASARRDGGGAARKGMVKARPSELCGDP